MKGMILFLLPLGGLLFLMILLMVVWDVPALWGPFFLSIMRLTSFALSWDLWRDGVGVGENPSNLLHLK